MADNTTLVEARAKLDALVAAAKAATTTATTAHLSLSQILARQQEAATKKQPVSDVFVPAQAAMAAALAASPLSGIAWNVRQQQAIAMATQGKSFVLIGAAGTGKTTTLKGCIHSLEVNHLLPPMRSSSKYLQAGAPGIICVSYTRRAVRQIARQLPPHLSGHALTVHKVLEYAPTYYEITKPDGTLGKTMRFEPQRHASNPLPAEIRVCVVDESSMVEYDPLFLNLKAALPSNCQFIFMGDLHQLPPVYGDGTLAKMLTEFPIVELTDVYRQALESPIIQLATSIKEGKDIPLTTKNRISSPDGKSNVIINPIPKQLSREDAMDMFATTIKSVVSSGNFNEEEDVILMPHNKAVGTIELNLHIANTLAVMRGETVHHVISGFMNMYLAVGDRLLVDKQDCVIRGIEKNQKYVGKAPMEPSHTLDRWGTYQDKNKHHYLESSDGDIDDMLEKMASLDVEDKVNQASHTLVLENLDSGNIFRTSDVGTFNGMVFSWALTVHKSQGSEWRRVFLFLHSSHHAMCSRELLYTAVTRAREDLIIVCEPDRKDSPGTLTKAARSPRIKGITLAEKLAWLKDRENNKISSTIDN